MKNPLPASPEPTGDVILYRSEDGSTRIEVRLEKETVWLTQKKMAELFGVEVQTINYHLQEVFENGELKPDSVIRKIRITAEDGKAYMTNFYNLDAIISIGYRVNSRQATQFRMWATGVLKEYMIKGFVMDDARLMRAGGGNYFEELLERIRDIRSSERVFWRKVLDIYATSIDYDPSAETSQRFFKTVQNKMHFAIHGRTAAEIIHERADATLPHMGLTSWNGDRPRRTDIGIAKNYLHAEELEALNRIVTAYLEFAELQAMSRRPMHMADWIRKLDDFLRLSGRELLAHAGKIAHDEAMAKAEAAFETYRRTEASLLQPVDRHFLQAMDELKAIEAKAKEGGKAKRNGTGTKREKHRAGNRQKKG